MIAMPTLDNLVVLAAIFNVTMDQIIVVDTDAKAQISAWIEKKLSIILAIINYVIGFNGFFIFFYLE